MEPSPKGRFIEDVEGEPQDIIDRGQKITTLGQQMLDCADTLETIKNQALTDGNQQGKAIEKLKESIGDSHDVLRQAGELYEPVGPVITQYGESLSTIQPSLNGHVADCESKWETYQSLPGDAEGSTTPEAGGGFLGMGGHDADSPEAKQEAQDNAAKKAAYEDWLESARAFDSNYDSWVSAFEDAADGIEDEMAGKIEDSFWDDISSFVEVVGTILSWAALIVGVIAIFFTGFALLAAILAVAAFVVTAIQYANGDKSLSDLIWSAVGIIPVGKLGNLAKLARLPKLAKGAGGVSNAFSRTWKALDKGDLHAVLSLTNNGPRAFAGKAKVIENLIGPSYKATKTATIKQFMGGNYQVLKSSLTEVRVLSGLEFGGTRLGKMLGHYGRVQTGVTNSGGEMPSIPNWATFSL